MSKWHRKQQDNSKEMAAEDIKQHEFTKGKSGNPNGRPKGAKNVSTVLKEMLEKVAPEVIADTKFVKEFCKGKKRVTSADATAARLMYEALVKGEPWAVKELMDRTEGKASQPLEHSGPDGGPIQQRVIVEFVGADDGD